jgi:hypothetical protein
MLAARNQARLSAHGFAPSRIAATELQSIAAVEVRLGLLRHFDQKMCLASNPRMVRIRPMLQNVGTALAQRCRF